MSDEPIARGHRAFNELQEVGYAFDAVKRAILLAIEQTPVNSDAKVLKLHMALQNLSAVKKALNDVIDSGKIEAASQEARNAVAVHGLTRPL